MNAPSSVLVRPVLAVPSGRIEQDARSALQSITGVLPPPPGGDTENWEAMSSAERLAVVSPASPIQLARAEVRNGRIVVHPERSDFPTFALPNNVGAEGFSPGFFTHDYLVIAPAPGTLTGQAGLRAIGAALVANPTPGQDSPSTGQGARNNVGGLVWGDGGTNYVHSYRIGSTNPIRSVTVVNYTVAGEHTMHEGFVLRFAELKRGGRIDLITYGEGGAIKQSSLTSGIWRSRVRRVWLDNAREIFATAGGGR